uniref:Uncharacterized protein n=1 Tax=Anopheles atroparvus TaxID=41427 RepID=A0A182IYM7_ANOAO
MFLLAGAGVLEPDLRHPLAQPRRQRYPLQVLPVRVAVHLEVSLQDVNLLLGERRADALRFVLSTAAATAVRVAAVLARARSVVDQLHVVRLAQDAVLADGELLAGRELPAARVTREAR